jgi:peroxiredoxin
MDLLTMLLNAGIQAKLQVTDQQAHDIRAAFGDHIGQMPNGQLVQRGRLSAEEAFKVEAVLNDQQKQRLNGLAFEERGGRMLLQPRIQAVMALTASQLEKIKQLSSDFSAQITLEAMGAHGGKSPGLVISKEKLDAFGGRLLGVLTKSQLSEFAKLSGGRHFKIESAGKPDADAAVASLDLLPVGTRMPDFSLKDASGKTHSAKDYRGKVVVMEFWATWCVPCRQMMPILQTLHNRYREKSVAVISVSIDSEADAAALLKKLGYSYPLLVKGVPMAAKYHVYQGVPVLYIMDQRGRIVHSQTGFSASHDSVRIPAIVGHLLQSSGHGN